MKKKLLLLCLVVGLKLNAVELGFEHTIPSLDDPLEAGFFQNYNTSVYYTPDTSSPWLHLINSRHSTQTNNYQLQLTGTFTTNDRLFFRKIANGNSPVWNEVATRGSNNFVGNQNFTGGYLSVNATSTNTGNNTAFFSAPNIGLNYSHIHWGTTGDWYIRSASSAGKVIIQDTGGNVGIGGYHGTRKLYVNQPSGNGIAHFRGQYGTYDFQQHQLRFETTNTNGASHLYLKDQDNLDSRYLIEALGAAGAVDALLVTSTGKVGIGTRNLTEKLNVNGTIRSKEIIVETAGWPDFVFEDDYALMSLNELGSFVSEKKHLPGLPSQLEVSTNGAKVGEVQMAILRQLEELSLHMIELKKENDKMKAALVEAGIEL